MQIRNKNEFAVFRRYDVPVPQKFFGYIRNDYYSKSHRSLFKLRNQKKYCF